MAAPTLALFPTIGLFQDRGDPQADIRERILDLQSEWRETIDNERAAMLQAKVRALQAQLRPTKRGRRRNPISSIPPKTGKTLQIDIRREPHYWRVDVNGIAVSAQATKADAIAKSRSIASRNLRHGLFSQANFWVNGYLVEQAVRRGDSVIVRVEPL
jgi:hypothetical protein